MDNFKIFEFFFIVGLIALGIFLLWFFIFKVKHLKTSDVFMIDGGVKVGKTLVTVKLSVSKYRMNWFKVTIGNCFIKFINLFRKKDKKFKLKEIPMLYSNMPLYHVKYNPLTMDIIEGKVRIPHKSVCLLDEASLIADSMTGMLTDRQKRERFDEINEKLTIFLKLYGHMSHGGSLYFNSQNVVDLHFAFKRNMSTYLFCAKSRNFPFFRLIDCRELMHDESGDVVNTIQHDSDTDNRPLFVSKRWYKYYDRYYLDVLTKHLPVIVDYDVRKLHHRHDKKEIKEIVTMGNYKVIHEYNNKNRGVVNAKK